jgi:hypothetical protein
MPSRFAVLLAPQGEVDKGGGDLGKEVCDNSPHFLQSKAYYRAILGEVSVFSVAVPATSKAARKIRIKNMESSKF